MDIMSIKCHSTVFRLSFCGQFYIGLWSWITQRKPLIFNKLHHWCEWNWQRL